MYNLKLVIIDTNYCNYLRTLDSKVAYNYGKKDTRPFIGILFNIGELEYFAPLYSPKPKHLVMKNTIDFLKIDNGILGAINFNNMIPVTSKNYILPDLNRKSKDINEVKYLILLQKQLIWLNNNLDKVKNKSQKLYKLYINNKLPLSIKNRCCNFKLLEKACKQYNNTKES